MLKRGNNIKQNLCSVQGCKYPVWSKGLCKNHTNKKIIKSKPKPNISGKKDEKPPMAVFMDKLWAKLPKIKKCWSCGKRIYGENLSIYWHHCLPKELYKEFMYEERNMMFVCADCHTEIENGFLSDKASIFIENVKKELLDNGNT